MVYCSLLQWFNGRARSLKRMSGQKVLGTEKRPRVVPPLPHLHHSGVNAFREYTHWPVYWFYCLKPTCAPSFQAVHHQASPSAAAMTTTTTAKKLDEYLVGETLGEGSTGKYIFFFFPAHYLLFSSVCTPKRKKENSNERPEAHLPFLGVSNQKGKICNGYRDRRKSGNQDNHVEQSEKGPIASRSSRTRGVCVCNRL
jgi:hypothetical protein